MTPIVAILDKTGRITFNELQRAVDAVQIQLNRDAAPHWTAPDGERLSGKLIAIGTEKDAPTGSWLVTIENNIAPADQRAATQLASMQKVYSATLYGYHLVNASGVPYARLLYTPSWTKILSHEVLEMLVNPYLTRMIGIELYSENPGEEKVIQEIADPVQATSYSINGIEVSNFIYPAWYHATKIEGERYDYLGIIKEPKKILEGGFKSFLTRTGEWFQTFMTDNRLTWYNISTGQKLSKSQTYRVWGVIGTVLGIFGLIIYFSKRKK